MKRMLFFLLTILLPGIPVHAQISKFGKISEEERLLDRCSFNPDAGAMVIFNSGIISIDKKTGVKNKDPECRLKMDNFEVLSEKHFRIKFFRDMPTDSVGLFSFTLRSIVGNKDQLVSFEGLLLPTGEGEKNKTKINLKNLKKVTHPDGTVSVKIDIPEVKKGTILDIKYTIKTEIFSELPTWDFMTDYPVKYSELKLNEPDFIPLQESCDIMDYLDTSTFRSAGVYDVSYPISNGYKNNAYEYQINHEQFSAADLPSKNATSKKGKFLILTGNIDLATVPCKSTKSIRR